MVTPREKRFGRLAVESGIMTRDQLTAVVKFARERQTESTSFTLWESAVLSKMMDTEMANKLLDMVGDLDVDELGKFKLLRLLGRGGTGSVWLALTPDKKVIAIKVLHSSYAGNRSFLTRFFREAQAAIKLQHKNIVRGVEVSESDGLYYFAMEYVDGRSVQAMLNKEGAFQPKRATEIILEVAEALAYAHEHNTIHRDIKPSNVMLTRDGRAKLTDLGLARVTQEGLTQLTATGSAMGTPTYMAPEQAADAKLADARSDIYSLGATWFCLVVGRPPFMGSTALELMHKHANEPLRFPVKTRTSLPKGVVYTIRRMMAKQPDLRIQTMQEVIQTINERCLGERDIFKELGIEKETPEKAKSWYLKTLKRGKETTLRVPEDKLLMMIGWGSVSANTLVCRAGEQALFKPIHSIPALAQALHITTPSSSTRGGAPSKEQEAPKADGDVKSKHLLHNIYTHYDAYESIRRRRKRLKQLKRTVLNVIIFAAVLGVLYLVGRHFWSEIVQLIKSLL